MVPAKVGRTSIVICETLYFHLPRSGSGKLSGEKLSIVNCLNHVRMCLACSIKYNNSKFNIHPCKKAVVSRFDVSFCYVIHSISHNEFGNRKF